MVLITLTLTILSSIAAQALASVTATSAIQSLTVHKTGLVPVGNQSLLILTDEKMKVNCATGTVLNSFQLKTINGAKVQYEYKCLKHSGVLGGLTGSSNSWTDSGSKGTEVHFLDRQKVQCMGGYGIKSFILTKNSNSKEIRYDYTCVKMDGRTCTKKETNKTDNGSNKAIVFFDRQIVAAAADEYLNMFQLFSTTGKFNYKFKSCNIHAPPAPQPTIIVDSELKTKNSDNQIAMRRLR